MSALSDTEENAVLDTLLNGRYLALHSADPTDVTATAVANELSEAGYDRVLCAFDAAASGSASNTDEETFTAEEDWPEVTHWSLWDNATIGAGAMKVHGAFATAKTAGNGDTLTVAAGAITVTAD
jgi:hypothetical protein